VAQDGQQNNTEVPDNNFIYYTAQLALENLENFNLKLANYRSKCNALFLCHSFCQRVTLSCFCQRVTLSCFCQRATLSCFCQRVTLSCFCHSATHKWDSMTVWRIDYPISVDGDGKGEMTAAKGSGHIPNLTTERAAPTRPSTLAPVVGGAACCQPSVVLVAVLYTTLVLL